MNKSRAKYSLAFICLITLAGCYPHADQIGRQPSGGSFEQRQKEQEELIRRQQEVLLRQERELQDLERQKHYDEEYRKFNPQPQ